MRIQDLEPALSSRVLFWGRSVRAFTGSERGCYALTDDSGHVLYIGRGILRARMEAHLGDPAKRAPRGLPPPVWFNFRELPAKLISRVETGLLVRAVVLDGALPPLNRVLST